MKKIFILFACLSTWSSALACFCLTTPFCEYIQKDYFANNGMICIAEYTGNMPVYTPNFSAYEMKLVDLLYGEMQPGTANYANTDSTFWVLLGSGAACYWDLGFGPTGTQLLLAPRYQGITDHNGQNEFGYALSSCEEDVMWKTNDTIQGYIYNQEYISININELPQLIDDCIPSCETNLSLTDDHDYPSIFIADSTIYSTAEVNSNVQYRANHRIRLNAGFKTRGTKHFSIVVDGCD